MAARPRPVVVSDRGSGPAVLLLHGQPGEGREWSEVAAGLIDSVRPIVPDRPGYGQTGGPAVGVAENTEALIALLDQREIDSAVVVGHSWGGAIALDLAERYPQRARALVLVASVGGKGSIEPLDRILALRFIGPVLSLAVLRAVQAPRVRRLVLQARPDDPVNAVIDNVATPWRAAWRSFVTEQRALVAELPMITQRLDQITAPATVIIGETDRLVRPACQEALASALPRAETIRVSGVGHLVPLQAPGVVVAAVLDAVHKA